MTSKSVSNSRVSLWPACRVSDSLLLHRGNHIALRCCPHFVANMSRMWPFSMGRWSGALHADGDYLFSNRQREDVMRRNIMAWTAMVAASSILLVSHAKAEQRFHATLSGFEELGSLTNLTGAIFSPGTGTLDLTINDQGTMITYTLTYSG